MTTFNIVSMSLYFLIIWGKGNGNAKRTQIINDVALYVGPL